MSNYRDNSISPQILLYFACLPEDLTNQVLELCLDARYRDEVEYHDWILEWKELYNYVSAISNAMKRDRARNRVDNSTYDRSIHTLRVTANTLLNARQVKIDSRRAKHRAELYP